MAVGDAGGRQQSRANEGYGAVSERGIEIKTRAGLVHCSPDEIVRRRFGIHIARGNIVLEYQVPKHKLLAHHPIDVLSHLTGLGGGGDGGSASESSGSAGAPLSDEAVAEELRQKHRPWLDGILTAQIAGLVGRLRNAAGKELPGDPQGTVMATPRIATARVSSFQRLRTIPPVARASKRSKEPEIRKAFDAIDTEGRGVLSLDDLNGYMGDFLGFGFAECGVFYDAHASAEDGFLNFESFRSGYASLNPFMVSGRRNETIIRRPGSLGGLDPSFSVQQINVEEVEDCEVYVCTRTGQAFADLCKRSKILFGPCDSSIFIRDCEDCTFWLAAQQLRTRDCKRCIFYLYSKTEPIIESSEDLTFAPWGASYPGCTEQFTQAKFDPKRNFWNALFDFTGVVGKSNWRIIPLPEFEELVVELDEPNDLAAPDNPVPGVTHELLCAEPLSSEMSTGEGVANIPQTRPDAPPAPDGVVTVGKRVVRDSIRRSK